MKKVSMTPEMENEILNNLKIANIENQKKSQTDGEKKIKKSVPTIFSRKILTIAASLVMIITAGVLVLPAFMEKELPQVIYERKEFDTLKDLKNNIDFKINDIDDVGNIPFEIVEMEYVSRGETFAEINYIGGNDKMSFRKSLSNNDNSGDYNLYEIEENINIEGQNILLKGDHPNSVILATWQDGEHAYSISLQNAINKNIMIEIIKDFF